MYPLIGIEPTYKIAFSEARDIAKPVCQHSYQLNGRPSRVMQATAKCLQLSYFSITHHQSWDAGMGHQFPLTSSFIEAMIHHTGLNVCS